MTFFWNIPDYTKQLTQIQASLTLLNRKVEKMAVDQATFDTDLAALVSAITTLTTAVDGLLASKPAVDLTAEEASVQAASQAVAAELAKITPTP